jgi:hypothetical protein
MIPSISSTTNQVKKNIEGLSSAFGLDGIKEMKTKYYLITHLGMCE